jgi:dolichyl-phosphate beta-glucosyltransferase
LNKLFSIVIPVFNEQAIIESTLKKIIYHFYTKKINYEIIIVNDGSNDKTGDIVKNLIENFDFPNAIIKLLDNKQNSGKGYSVRRGVLAAEGKYVLFTDADLSTPIEEEEKLSGYLGNGFNIAIGSRDLPGSQLIERQNIIRESMGKFFNLLVRKTINIPYRDTQCGFKIFDQMSIEQIFPLLKINDFSFDVEILYLAKLLNLKVKEVPIVWKDSKNTKVSLLRDSIKMLLSLFKIKRIHSGL